jgi:ArsR family transcriptional regulator, virulence genes transcriptional regulator
MYSIQEEASMEHQAEEQAKYCRVFGNARRVQILWALADRELSVGAIAEAVSSSLQNVSQHLSIMKQHNLVTSRREGQTIYYRIKADSLEDHCLGLLRAKQPPSAITIHQDEKPEYRKE